MCFFYNVPASGSFGRNCRSPFFFGFLSPCVLAETLFRSCSASSSRARRFLQFDSNLSISNIWNVESKYGKNRVWLNSSGWCRFDSSLREERNHFPSRTRCTRMKTQASIWRAMRTFICPFARVQIISFRICEFQMGCVEWMNSPECTRRVRGMQEREESRRMHRGKTRGRKEKRRYSPCYESGKIWREQAFDFAHNVGRLIKLAENRVRSSTRFLRAEREVTRGELPPLRSWTFLSKFPLQRDGRRLAGSGTVPLTTRVKSVDLAKRARTTQLEELINLSDLEDRKIRRNVHRRWHNKNV
jgi:hypothetical protein